MEFRAGLTILNVDRKLNIYDEKFLEGTVNLIEAVMLGGQSVLASKLMEKVLIKMVEDLEERNKIKKEFLNGTEKAS